MVLGRIFISGYQLPEVKPGDNITLIVNGKAQDFKTTHVDQVFPEKSFTANIREESTVYAPRDLSDINKCIFVATELKPVDLDYLKRSIDKGVDKVVADGTKGMERGR